ncbi:GD17746 [Drosophila simulans]|uniref:GD17746 n=1 Tax=Drosophila simulans TaxID=7240 RepID=B4NSY3_DROSI|nr:GD17746 [Drosophila simulans]
MLATFADDVCLTYRSRCEHDAADGIQDFAYRFSEWARRWNIGINSSKSNNVCFTLKRRTPPPVYIEEVPVPQPNAAKYLGVLLDRRLTFSKHVTDIRTRLRAKVAKHYWLLSSRSKLSLSNKLTIYKQILAPNWKYGCQIWGLACDSHIKRIQAIQNKVARLTTGCEWFVRNTTLHRDLKLATLQSRPKVTGCLSGARDGHSACVIGNSMYIFGGFVDEINELSSDVHSFNLDTMEWRYVKTFGVPPSYRDFHASPGGELLSRDRLPGHEVFGGYNGLLDHQFNDLYTFASRTKLWNLIRANGKAPTARRRQCAIVIGTRMFLFGGTSPRSGSSSSPAAVSPTQEAGRVLPPSAALIDCSDLHVLDFESTLKTLATMVVLKHQLDISELPRSLRSDLQMLTQPNSIIRPINQAC